MAGTGWQSSDLLTLFNRYAGRPAGDAMADADKYDRLGRAQAAVITEIAGIYAKSLFGAPAAMTTADGGKTYTFGTDGDGYPLFPIGPASIFTSLAAIPDYPWVPGVDYLDEGTQIRIPNDRTYTGTLYWYGVTIPQLMSATVQPILEPPSARILIVYKAVQQFALENNRNPELAVGMQSVYGDQFGKTMTLLRKHFRGGGALGPLLWPWGRPNSPFGPGWSGAWWA